MSRRVSIVGINDVYGAASASSDLHDDYCHFKSCLRQARIAGKIHEKTLWTIKFTEWLEMKATAEEFYETDEISFFNLSVFTNELMKKEDIIFIPKKVMSKIRGLTVRKLKLMVMYTNQSGNIRFALRIANDGKSVYNVPGTSSEDAMETYSRWPLLMEHLKKKVGHCPPIEEFLYPKLENYMKHLAKGGVPTSIRYF